jgi:DNA-binding NarL/FixJ family response regulator
MTRAYCRFVDSLMNHTPRIQIVEDQYFVALNCEMCLQEAGFRCTGLATTAANAFDFAERDRPELIIMDIRLASRIDGVDAAIAIFERLGIRCIFASAHADTLVRKQAERAHPLGWLDKPYSNEQLVHAVRRAVDALGVEPDAKTSINAASVGAH